MPLITPGRRIQGKNLLQILDKNAPSVPIIQHPDIRRQLMTMKVYVEGIRSLLYYVGMCEDRIKITEDIEEKTKHQGIVDVLIPIAKGYVTDRCFEVCSHGIQIYGGLRVYSGLSHGTTPPGLSDNDDL